MSKPPKDPPDTQILTSLAKALEARRGLALESVQILMEGLRCGDPHAIHLGLRGLGVNENCELYEKIGIMTHSLHTLLHDFRRGLAESEGRIPDSGANIINAAQKLEEVLNMGREAAEETRRSTEQVAELLHQQEYAMQIAREVLNDPTISESERNDRLNEFLNKQESSVTAIRVVNQHVLMTQSFQEMTSEVLRKVIKVIQDIENHLVELDSTYGSSEYTEDESESGGQESE